MLFKSSKIVPLIFLFLLLVSSTFSVHAQEQESDIIKLFLDSSKVKNYSFKQRQKYVLKALDLFELNERSNNDGLQLTNISLAFYRLNDSINFRKLNRKAILISAELNDSLNLANNYWDLGNFYSKNGIKDSAFLSFSSAQKIYQHINDDFYSARMLLNMAIMQSDVRDYTGSEITTMEAIKIFKPLNEYRHLYRAYNNLGVNFNELGEYDKSLIHHNKALDFQDKIESANTFKESTLNNIGVSYEMQTQFETAIEYYNRAFENPNLKIENITLYARLVDNLAYSRFKLEDTIGVLSKFNEALFIRDSTGDLLGQAINKLHLAEFQLYKGDTIEAINLAKNVMSIAKQSNNNRELLASLLFLSKIDLKNFRRYTNEYILLSDSLQIEERAVRNKFARIRFETDEFIEANIKLDRQRRIIILVASFVLLTGLLLFIIKNQQNKNKELRFEREQQQSNEEIYKLMISQQNKVDEGSRKEKNRISKELHDGVLGRLFGTRLLLGTINAKSDRETIEQREKYIDELQSIEQEIRNISHELHVDAQIKNIGYPNLVESLLENQSKIGKFNGVFKNDPKIGWEEIDGGIKMNVYRILQEALQNINKYAKASQVNLDLSQQDSALLIRIEDDGVGFDTRSNYRGIGLKNMKSRVLGLSGEFEVFSNSGQGTALQIHIPIETESS